MLYVLPVIKYFNARVVGGINRFFPHISQKTYSTYTVYVVEYCHKMNEIVRISFKEEKECENITVAFEAKFVDAINVLCRIHG